MADTDTAPVALPDSVIEQVAAIVGDRLRTPADKPFAEHPSFYGGDDRVATLTIRPQDTAEVALILPILAEARVPVVVRGGGHSMAHRSRTTGVIIDLALLDTVHIDAEGKVGTAGGGVIAGRYTEEAAKHGLATGFGDWDRRMCQTLLGCVRSLGRVVSPNLPAISPIVITASSPDCMPTLGRRSVGCGKRRNRRIGDLGLCR